MENSPQQLQEEMIEPILQYPQIVHSDESYAKPNQIQVNLDENQAAYQNQQNQQQPYQNQSPLYNQQPPYQQLPPYQNPQLPIYQNPPLPPYSNQPFYQNQPQPPYANQQQPIHVIIQQPISNQFQYSTQPIQFYCSKCQKTQISQTHPRVGDGTHIIAVALCFVTVICCWIPYVVESCQDVIHFCPECKTEVGRKKFIDL